MVTLILLVYESCIIQLYKQTNQMQFLYVFIVQFLYNCTYFERPFYSSSGVHDLLYSAALYKSCECLHDFFSFCPLQYLFFRAKWFLRQTSAAICPGLCQKGMAWRHVKGIILNIEIRFDKLSVSYAIQEKEYLQVTWYYPKCEWRLKEMRV